MSQIVVKSGVDSFARRNAAQMRAAIALGGEYLLGEANKTVPHASGILEASATTDLEGKSTGQHHEYMFTVAYTAEYALKQHEDTSLNHPDPNNPASRPGTRAKWLELAAEENEENIEALIKKVLGMR